MCHPFSCIYHRTLGIITHKDWKVHSHERIIRQAKLTDISGAVSPYAPISRRDWVRIEIRSWSDVNNLSINPAKNPRAYTFKVDEGDTIPGWFKAGRVEKECRKVMSDWWNKNVRKVYGFRDGGRTFLGGKKRSKQMRLALPSHRKFVDKVWVGLK